MGEGGLCVALWGGKENERWAVGNVCGCMCWIWQYMLHFDVVLVGGCMGDCGCGWVIVCGFEYHNGAGII